MKLLGVTDVVCGKSINEVLFEAKTHNTFILNAFNEEKNIFFTVNRIVLFVTKFGFGQFKFANTLEIS